jgi:hypothetical protein
VLALLAGHAARAGNPIGGGGTVVLEPLPSSSAPRTLRRVVYTCVSPGLVVFSDRPCGPLPQLHEVRLLDPAAGRTGAPATVRAPEPAATTRRDARPGRREPEGAEDDESDAAGLQAATCRRLEHAVRALDDRMRSGYSAREAARLWARWREARSRLREADC